jgi:hypothetical protein
MQSTLPVGRADAVKKQANTLFFRAKSAWKQGPVTEPERGTRALRVGFASGKRKIYRVGVWDINAHAGLLYRVFESANRKQKLFKFHPVEATAPIEITAPCGRAREMARASGFKGDDSDLENNTFVGELWNVGPTIAATLRVDFLVIVLAAMLMDYDEDNNGKQTLDWNYFSLSQKNVVIASAYDLRDYAKQVKRPFEACLAALIFAQLLSEMFDLEAHEETRGCLSDYCENRADLMLSLRGISLCKDCLEKIPNPSRSSVVSVLDAIRDYRR